MATSYENRKFASQSRLAVRTGNEGEGSMGCVLEIRNGGCDP